jgi:hypothetical protein
MIKGPNKKILDSIRDGRILEESFKYLWIDAYTLKSEKLSLTFEDKWCHAEFISASRFAQEVRS